MGQNLKISLAKMTGRYVGQPFADCSCVQLFIRWYGDLGIYVPDTYGDLTVDNYFEAWEKDRQGFTKIMLEYFKTLGESVEDLTRLERHDLLAVEEDGNTYAAVCLGGGMAIKSHLTEGVRVFHTGDLHRVVLARRLLSSHSLV